MIDKRKVVLVAYVVTLTAGLLWFGKLGENTYGDVAMASIISFASANGVEWVAKAWMSFRKGGGDVS